MADLTRASKCDVEVAVQVDHLFDYQPWDEEQKEAGRDVRTDLSQAYKTIINSVPPCPTRTRALNMLTDCRMLCNAAITHRGKY